MGERVKFEKELNRLNENLINSLDITNKQKDIIELANTEITDNIKYAERIQHAIFPSLEDINSILKNNFILWKPFNIISGDFYWVKQIYNKTYVAVGDCTGHGVSGALLSMLGCSLIEDIVSNQYFDNASHILNLLQEHFEYKLRNHVLGTQIADGMDISICIIDYEQQKIHFSAANHELIYIRNDVQTIIKGDKMCIGKQDTENISFTEYIIAIQEHDLFYMFTDGFASQFGGEKDKKYSKKRFKNTLMNIHGELLSQQKNALELELAQWMDPDYKQIDDILVLGFQI
jgi:serine phosphatase RsbU (regulator of sigma subunit)